MQHTRSLFLLAACGTLMSLNNCVADAEQPLGIDTQDVLELSVGAGETMALQTSLPSDMAVVITVDCKVPTNVDAAGAVIAVDAETLLQSSDLDGVGRAAYWQWAGVMSAGAHKINVSNVGNESASCAVSMQAQSDETSCTERTVHRSVIGTATHLPVGNESYGEWEAFPASGNHWGAWATWNTVYDKPVLRGFYLHNLEHGGLVLSYGCSSADESAACQEAETALRELADKFGQTRILITPDPNQPTMFAVRGWRLAYASDCLDEASALDFMNDHFRRGREDINGDPPLQFDPTTTENVPCEVLMAAPDGC
jgi:hypothetical protein